MCHELVNPEHVKSPSPENRPAVRTDHRACATCHEKQLESMLDMTYHMNWAAKNEIPSYNAVPETDGNYYKLVQSRMPRYHVGMLADITVNRGGGRFKYKNEYDAAMPVERLWDKVYDAIPEDGDDKLVLHERALAWRPHKNIGMASNAFCFRCKTADTILDYAYLGMPAEGAPLQRDSSSMPLLKKLNTSANCIFCHDPHSAEPRLVNDMVIEAMISPEYKDNAFQSHPEYMPKAEVINMGERGYERKIVILDRYDANFMCGQCHSAPSGSATITEIATGKAMPGVKPGNPYAPIFTDGGPLESYAYYKKMGWYSGVHPITKTKWAVLGHPHMEIASQSVHAKAGVTCTSCHYEKKKGYSSHQVSLPKEKVVGTCLRSDCHGAGTKANWTTAAQALYTIEMIQQKGRVRTRELNNSITSAVDFINDAKNKGIYTFDAAKMAVLDDKLGQALTVENWWFGDYSIGFHNPAMYESSVTTAVKELNAALTDVKSGAKPK
jgi:formate-dependent nitrite reductase cytochrome c552 subunit